VILRSGVPGIFVIQGVIAKSKKHRYSAAFANSGARTGSLTNAGWQKASSSFEADALITDTDMAPAISDQNQFLSELSATELAVLRPHLVDCDITAGDCLQHIGDPVKRVVFPHSAVVGMTLPLRDAARAVVAWVGREGIVGGLFATASTPSSCKAEACIGGRASFISAAAFRHALDHHPVIARLAARYDAATMAQVQQNAVCNAAHKVAGRICRCLLELHDRSGDDKIPLKQDTLAQLLAIRRTTVTLVAGGLEKHGVIICGRGYMRIVSRDELRRRSCECYGRVKGYQERLHMAEREDVAHLQEQVAVLQ
jgi:CRP-like cAMP-binding protein